MQGPTESCGNGIKSKDKFNVTKVLHLGQEPKQWTSKAVVPPIVNSTTFAQVVPGQAVYDYSRSGNPTRACLEATLASCEGARYGLAFASGLGATTTLQYLMKSGDHILACSDMYGGTNRILTKCMNRMGIEVSLIDMADMNEVSKQVKPNTRMMWVETPTNPLMSVIDIEAAANVCKAHKNNNILLVVDNTFATPCFQRPLAFGADIVVHSATKYLNGHSDVVMGCVMLNDQKIYEELKFLQNSLGIVPSPFDCFLVNRGMKTLKLRMEKHMENVICVAEFLTNHPMVSKVFFPFAKDFERRAVVEKQMTGTSGMISFVLKESCSVQAFLDNLKVFTLAESLGGFESLVCIPAAMTHASVESKHRQKIGLVDNLIRLSVGLEEKEDLCNDLKSALDSLTQ